MDIDRLNFWEQLPTMLEAICESQYVAVDLEMSGIHVRKSHPGVQAKPTVQEAYDDAREAAHQYTILQFGFTCITWDPDKKSYVTKTFNMPLHPGVVVDKSSSSWLPGIIKRSFGISTSSLGYLEGTGFNFPDVFRRGVPYMSLAERSFTKVEDFISGNRPADEGLLDVNNLPRMSMDFRNDVKEKVSAFREPSRAQPRPVRIYSPLASGHRLNGLQKRIVHQLLQDEFPNLVAVSRDGSHYLEIITRSVQSDHPGVMTRTRAIARQIGARILWDAISGRPFAHNTHPERNAGTDPVKRHELDKQILGYESRLRKKSPILVGHNMLFDLCFLHKTFVVDLLPESVQEFRAIMREAHPRMVDTKYLFARGGDEMSPDYSLAECFAAVKNKQLPAVMSGPSHTYSKPLRHQAGYDSYMTAVVFLKKSYQQAQTREHLGYIASEDLGENEAVCFPFVSRPPRPVPGQLTQALQPMPDVHEAPQTPWTYSRAWLAARRPAMPTKATNLLEDSGQDDLDALDRAGWAILKPHRPWRMVPTTAPQTPESSPEREQQHRGKSDAGEAGMLPEWGGRFWDKYGNRTRVGPFSLVLYMPRMAGEEVPS